MIGSVAKMVKHVCFEFLIQFIEKNICHIMSVMFECFEHRLSFFILKQRHLCEKLLETRVGRFKKTHPKYDKVICENFLTWNSELSH